MADPRSVSRKGVNAETLPVVVDNSTIVYDATKKGGCARVETGNNAVTWTDTQGVVKLAVDGEAVCGVLLLVEKDLCATMQVEGQATMKGGDGAALTPGTAIVGAVRSAVGGYIRDAASGTAAELVLAAHRIIDDNSADAVEVYLG